MKVPRGVRETYSLPVHYGCGQLSRLVILQGQKVCQVLELERISIRWPHLLSGSNVVLFSIAEVKDVKLCISHFPIGISLCVGKVAKILFDQLLQS